MSGDDRNVPSAFDERVPDEPATAGRGEFQVIVAFGVTIAAAVGLVVTYLTGAHIQLLGVFGALAFAGLAYAVAAWTRLGLANPTVVEDRQLMADADEDADALLHSVRRGTTQFGRRPAVLGMLGAALTALAVPLVGLISSLGPAPRDALRRTAWRSGVRLVDIEGEPVRPDALPLEAALPVFPDGATDQQRSRSQAVLLRVPPDVIAQEARANALDNGLVAYSRLCTHAGCALSLFQGNDRRPDAVRRLMCPCHQSLFDVTRDCQPIAGPAPRPLPQLPIAVDDDGYLIAVGDFDGPVGPGFWEQDR